MSRCFPYPPPGYSRNGATYEALIESIKLQKETDKAKAERKKEKKLKKEKKKEKERRKDEEKLKAQKNPKEIQIDTCKGIQSSVNFNETNNKKREPSTEQLEKSDLTEEHGQPLGHKPSYSSDSTQNSNKRKRDEDDAFLPGGTSGQGKPIKIRLLKKNQTPDSTESPRDSDPRSNTWKISSSVITEPSVQLSQQKQSPGLSRPGSIKNDAQVLHFSRNQPAASSGRPIPPSSQSKYETPSSTNSVKTDLPIPPGSRKNDKQLATKQAKYEMLGLSLSKNELPAPSASRKLTPSVGKPFLPTNQAKHEAPSSNSNKPSLIQPSKSSKPELSAPSRSRKPILPLNQAKPEIPSSKTPKLTKPLEIPVAKTPKLTKPLEIPVAKDSGLTRVEKKMKKQHTKYEQLLGSWVPPPVFEAAQLSNGDDDQDWLLKREKTSGSLSSSAMDGVETCREMASLWRPSAHFMAEVDMFAMPYTVPF